MHYLGPIYRPPYEAESLLLQVTSGCSHNACTFCAMYKGVPYKESPFSEIEADIRELAFYRPNASRVFLLNGDAFSLPASDLKEICLDIRANLPRVETITCYASVNSIIDKSDRELKSLARLGVDEINVGLESGLDDVLSWMNKGYDLATAREQLMRLSEAGIKFSVNIINAAAGPARIHEHAAANAAIVNEVQPYLVFISPLHVDGGSRLEQLVARGEFEECTMGEYITEELEFLEQLEMRDCLFFGAHVSNPVKVIGKLPQDKNRLVRELRDGMVSFSERELASHPVKGAEGRLYL